MRQLAATFTLDPAQMNPLLFHSNGSYQGAADEDRVTFMAPGAWTAETTEPWIHLDKVSGQGDATNSQYVLVTVDVNAGTQARQGKVRILGGETPLEVLVQQQGEFLELQYNNYDFDGGGHSSHNLQAFIEVSSSDPNWTVQVLQDAAGWLLASKATIGDDNKLKLVADQNGPEIRVGTVRVTNPSGLSRDLVVSQRPQGLPGAQGSNSGWVAPKLEVWSPDGTSTNYSNDVLPLMTFAADNLSGYKVKSTSDWNATLSTGCDWIVLGTQQGLANSDNGTDFNFSVVANTGTSERQADITFTNAQGVNTTVTVKQPGDDTVLKFRRGGQTGTEITDYPFNANAQDSPTGNSSDRITLQANHSWTAEVTTGGEWLSLMSGSQSGVGTTTLSVSVAGNGTGTERTGKIIATSGSKTAELTVTQAAGTLSITSAAKYYILSNTGVTSTVNNERRIVLSYPTGVTPNVVNDVDWLLHANPKINYNQQLYFGANNNSNSSGRVGRIGIVMGSQRVTVPVFQNGTGEKMPFGVNALSGASIEDTPYFFIDNDDLNGDVIRANSGTSWGGYYPQYYDVTVNFRVPEGAVVSIPTPIPTWIIDSSLLNDTTDRRITLDGRNGTNNRSVTLNIRYKGHDYQVTLIQD